MPTAVISGASLGAARSGRYATRSIITLRVPLVSIADHQRGEQPEDQPEDRRVLGKPDDCQNQMAVTSEPIMNTSPWAKLISSMIP